MADTQQRTKESGGMKELVILVGILLMVVAGAVGTYWVRSQGVEAAGKSACHESTPAWILSRGSPTSA